MISPKQCCAAIASLVRYSVESKLLDALDVQYAENVLLRMLELDTFEPDGEAPPFPQCLELLCDYAVENGRMDDTVTQRDLFDTLLMDVITPKPSEVIRTFRGLYAVSAKAATDYFYRLSQSSNYIRPDRIARDLRWTCASKYGELEISINLSKPEKDPRDIAAAALKKPSGYPKCQLCAENEGYAGTLSYPARENLRIIPIEICGEQWGLQYSPYVYYNEHCIVLNKRHVPMSINDAVFPKLFSFVEQFPHYFVGSNADLPIVGGSILSHEHFQGGCHVFPMERAEKELSFSVLGYENVECSVLKYPMTVLRLTGEDKDSICRLASRILEKWRAYTDAEAFIYAETDGERHNTVTPIARMNGKAYELDLVLRNNITTSEHPMGVFHPHEELHHIKKENIGLIEVMGLAILPGRLKTELELLKAAVLNGENLRENGTLSTHADWVEEFLPRHPEWSEETANGILQQEIGLVFEHVLECAGVYKCTAEGRRLLKKFLQTI